MRTLDNYLPEIEDVAERMLAEVGHTTGSAHPPLGESDGRVARI